MATRKIPTAARLREILFYDPETGDFFWIERKHGRRFKVGSLSSGQYDRITVDYHEYKAHHLAWLYMTGEWPKGIVDHINTDKRDNSWANLRLTTQQQNAWNRRKLGVRRTKEGYWMASICREYLGTFTTKEEAREAYCRAAISRYGEYVHSSVVLTGINIKRRDNEMPRKDNTSGFSGVGRIKRGKWRARVNGRHIGCFNTPEEAHQARLNYQVGLTTAP